MPSLFEILENPDSLTDIDAGRNKLDHLAFIIPHGYQHEIDCHEIAIGNANRNVMAHDLARHCPPDVLSDLLLHLRLIGKPSGLGQTLTNDIPTLQPA